METSTLTTLLGETWFGATLPVTARARLAVAGRVVDLPDGTAVIQEGKPCPAMGIVLDGRVAIRLGLPPQPQRTILTIDRGDVFGWSATLPTAVARSTCTAIGPVRAILFEAVALRAALDADPELAAAVYLQLLGSVARRLDATRVQLLDLYRTAAEPW